MQPDAPTVRYILGLFEPTPPPLEEAERLGAMVGSWPEMLAHLLLRRGALRTYPEIAASIRQRAAGCGNPATPRPPGADMQRLERTEAALEAALATALQAEKERVKIADKVNAAWRDYLAERPAAGFDLHLRIATEDG